MKLDRKELGRILRFGITGGLSTLIHYGVYLLLLTWLNPSLSYTCGYFVGFCFNYFLTTHFTFKTKTSVRNAAGFSISHVINYFLELGVLNLLIYCGMENQLAGFVTMVIVVPINFLLLRLVYLWKK